MTEPRVAVLMGSLSDYDDMAAAVRVLAELTIPYEVRVLSAHRSPAAVARYASEAGGRGIQMIIAGAGGAAHLAGVLAAHTRLPVIGVPLVASSMGGLDALLATVQMPGGVPVATVGVGRSGAVNAAHLAARILALADAPTAEQVDRNRDSQGAKVERMQHELEARLAADGL